MKSYFCGCLAALTIMCVDSQAGAAQLSGASSTNNPLLETWDTPFQVPPFGRIKDDHFVPAIKEAMARHLKEVDSIAGSASQPTFANTVVALDASGELLERAAAVFENLFSAETNERLQEAAKELAPLRAAHTDAILLNEPLFRRIKAVWDARGSANLNTEDGMLLERTYKRFARNGALLDPTRKQRLRVINEELAALGVKFADHLLDEMNAYRLVVEDKRDLAGLPESVIASAADAAKAAGLAGKWVFTLHGPSLWPFLASADNRELRKQIFLKYTARGRHSDGTDNRGVCARMAALRTEKARLLGCATWADFVLGDNMAGSPGRTYQLLNQLWGPAKALAAREAADLQAAIKADGKDFELQPWDWFYYTEKIRHSRFDLDEEELRQYLPLARVCEGAFEVARRLYGVTFAELKDMPVYNPEVKAYEVKDADGAHLAIFYVDYHPRPGKRSGAWCSEFRTAWLREAASVRPIVANVGNFSRPAGGAPALLTVDEVETLFHELGHALHAMLSRVRYRGLGATPLDFVELPSQIMENWAMDPEVLRLYARHWKTGEPIPQALLKKVEEAEKFNQGFKTTEYLAASLLDLDWHTQTIPAEVDTDNFERISLARMGVPDTIVPRYRSTYFQHIFGGSFDYSAGYYSYIWAEVLDADAFEAFREKGLFDQATAASFRKNILEKGWGDDPMLMYEKFRGRPPVIEPLLVRRGLAGK